MMPGRQTAEFHLCAGTHPYEVATQKINFPLYGVYIFSFLANIYLPIRIRRHQKNSSNIIDSHSLYDTKSATLVVFCLGASLSFMLLSYRVDLTELNEPRKHFLAHFSQLISPNLVPLVGSTSYLFTHKTMRLKLLQGISEKSSLNCCSIA